MNRGSPAGVAGMGRGEIRVRMCLECLSMRQKPAAPVADLLHRSNAALSDAQRLVRPQPSAATLVMNDSLEARLQATLNVIPAYTWYAAPRGALTFVNERSADFLGLPADHPLRFGIDTGAAWDAHIPLLHPDDHDETRRVWSNCLKTGCAGQLTFRVRDAHGRYRSFVSRAEPLRADDGTLLHWIGINLDIEERQQAEFYLAEGQRLAHMGSWAFDAGGFAYWSSELFEIHGLKPDGNAPSTADYLALVHPEDRDFVAQEMQKMLANHGRFDFTKRIVRPDGGIRHVRCVGTRATNGPGLVGTAIDVTEQEELTQALRRSEEEFRLLVDGIAAQVSTMSATGELEFVNQQVLDYFGRTSEDLQDWRSADSIHPDDLPAVLAEWRDCQQTGRPYDIEKRIRRFDGMYHWYRARGRPARDAQGRIIRWYMVLSDIEDR
ncbi:MAG TPA: PAS domain-containing protein, partial [Steroidobacteraceae bacterium]|nr:PAS domain-containing protein [Steroidobacteraceae bacterium]